MFKAIWLLLTKQSESEMKGMDMCWEWNWPTMWSSKMLQLIDFGIRFETGGDHSPGVHVVFVLFNCKLLDFGYYNSYHEVEDPEDIAEAEEWNAAVAEAHKIIRERKRNRADV